SPRPAGRPAAAGRDPRAVPVCGRPRRGRRRRGRRRRYRVRHRHQPRAGRRHAYDRHRIPPAPHAALRPQRDPPSRRGVNVSRASEKTMTTSTLTTTTPIIGRFTLRGHISIMRIDHWFKNVFVLPGIIAAIGVDAANATDGIWLRIILGMASICLVASSNYVINEVLDAPSDLSHPIKR